MLDNSDLQQYITEIIKRILFVGFFLALLKFGPGWARAIVESFEKLGKQVSFHQCASASDVFEVGIQVVSKMMADARWYTGEFFLVSIISVIVMGCFAIVAGILVVTTVEMYLVLSAAVILLGFGATRWTDSYAKNYMTYALAIGLKLFGLLLVVDVGFQVILYWQYNFAGNQIEQAMMLMGGLIVYLAIVWTIPGILASLVGSASPSSANNLIRTFSVASSLGTTATLMGHAGQKIGRQSIGMASAAKAGVGMARTEGKKGFFGVTKGAVSNVASAFKDNAASNFSTSIKSTTGGQIAERIRKSCDQYDERK